MTGSLDPLVSVIIPCRNAGRWLRDSVASCLAQTWRNLEVIVVDDDSSDDSLTVARSFRDPRMTVTKSDRRGASAARNAGLAAARGEFIQFLDADDVLFPRKIEAQLEMLGTSAQGTVASGAWAHFSDEWQNATFVPEPVWRDFSAHHFLLASWMGGGMMPVFAWLTPRGVMEQAGLWNENLTVDDDGEFFARVNLACSGVVFCEEARGAYRRSTGASLSRRTGSSAWQSRFSALQLETDALLRQDRSAAAREAAACHYLRFAYDAYPRVPDLVRAAEKRVGELGGSSLEPAGGRTFRALSLCFGWKAARRCERAWSRIRRMTPFHRSGASG